MPLGARCSTIHPLFLQADKVLCDACCDQSAPDDLRPLEVAA